MDYDKENQQSSDYQPLIKRVPIVNFDYSYILRNDPMYLTKKYNELEILYHEACEELKRLKLSM
jgi:hypothetical protein